MWALDWLKEPLDAMADVYVTLDVPRREQMAGAVDKLNARLRSDPLGVGESRDGGYRFVFLPDLAVRFHVDTATRTVTVTDAGPRGRA